MSDQTLYVRVGVDAFSRYRHASPAELQAAYVGAVEAGTIEGAEPDYEAATRAYNDSPVPIRAEDFVRRIVAAALAGCVVVREEPNHSSSRENIEDAQKTTNRVRGCTCAKPGEIYPRCTLHGWEGCAVCGHDDVQHTERGCRWPTGHKACGCVEFVVREEPNQ